MKNEEMQEIFSDEAFVESLFALETPAEVRSALKEKGVELSEEEILAVRDLLGKVENGEISAEQMENWAKRSEDGELSDEALEQVAGGLASVVIAGYVFKVAAVLIGAAAGYGGYQYLTDRRW